MENNIKKYFKVTNLYLADALAFIGYKYFKNGFGKETTYTFQDTQQIQLAINELINMRKQLVK